MAVNRGKKFEGVIRKAFESTSNTSVIRLPDPPKGYLGWRNISDFIVYHYPYQYFIECKSVHGNTLPFSNITDNQWDGLFEMSQIKGVQAGVICWWVDKDITRFIPIKTLVMLEMSGQKSYRWNDEYNSLEIIGKKKRIFFNYNMEEFFNAVNTNYRHT